MAVENVSIGDFVSWQSSGGTARGKIERIERDGIINIPDSSFTVEGTDDDPAALIRIFREQDDGFIATDRLVGHKFSTLTKINDLPKPSSKRNEQMVSAIDEAISILNQAKIAYESEESDDKKEIKEDEYRAVDLSAPAFMRASAKRGLALHEQGESGDGLVPATVADARRMANGEPLSENKWRKISPWIARHIVDLDAVQGDEITAGLVAMLLWGGGSSKASARRAQAYAERVVAKLDETK
jgi:hypothetical protein